LIDRVIGAGPKGFRPFHCNSHPNCGLSAYLLVNQRTGQSVPVTRLFDFEQFLSDVHALAARTPHKPFRPLATASLMRLILKAYRPDQAPEGLSWLKLIKTADALTGRRLLGIARKRRYEWRLLFITGMHFQDSYNYQADRVQRCTIHYSAPDGNIYPFCSYNSGACFRETVEREHSVPRAEWLKTRGGRYVTEGFEA
jgi:uncharacterized radical SAM superfamily Fe-S cluster-containing enzyme